MPRLLLALGLAGLTAPGLLAQSPADQSPTITGTLTDERGAPAADIEVVLRPYPSDYEVGLQLLGAPDALPEVVDRTRSGSDGSYSVWAGLAGPYRLELQYSASADQPVPAQPVVIGNLVPLQGTRLAETIEVPNRHLVAVRVLDADGGPVEGALAIAHPTLWMSPRYLSAMAQMLRDSQAGNYSRPQEQRVFPSYHPAASRTDSEGIARFPMPTEDANVLVSAPGFVQGKARTASGRAAFRLEHDPGIRLRVRGPNGRPAPGVLIRTPDIPRNTDAASVLRMLGTPGALGTPTTPLAVTDDNGEAVISGAVGSETALELLGVDYSFARVSVPAAKQGAPSPGEQVVDVRLAPPLRVPGRVVDTASGLPIDGAAIWVQASPGDSVFSDPTGAFDLTTKSAVTATRLQVTADGYIPERTDVPASEALNPAEVRIGLRPVAPIRGVVTDSSGRPVGGAKIRAEPRGSGVAAVSMLASVPVTSAADGSFQVAEATYGYAYRLTTRAPGYANALLDLPPLEPGLAAQPVHLVLNKGRPVLGTVVDTEGDPVAEAQVSLLWPLDPSDFRSRLEMPAAAAATDDQGSFVLPATDPSEYEVRVSHSDYADRPLSTVDVPAGESEFDLGDLTLVAGATIHGIVTGVDGEPVARAAIQALERNRIGAAARTATTDADGRFHLYGFSSDLADLGVRAAGYPLLVRPGVRVDSADPVRIELQPGASVAGRVLDNGGNGAAGIPVRLRIERDYRSGGDPRLWTGAETFPRRVTDQDGRFRFDRIAAGTWSAEARKGTEGAKLDKIELIPGAEREIELVLQTRDRLTVIVTTAVGEPVAHAQITIESPGELLPSGYGRTDGSGQSLMDITPGSVTVKVGHEQLRDASRQVQLEPGDNELLFELQPGLEISGTVRSHDGAPLALATVAAVTVHSFDTEFHRTNTVSDESGAFRLTGLEPGRYNVTARSPGYADGGPDQPIRTGDDAIGGLEIVLEPGAFIVGVVTGLTPSDLTQVRIRVSTRARSRNAAPDTEGKFTVDGLAPGTWSIVASKGTPGSELRVRRSVTIEPGAAETFVELPFKAGLRLSGQVFDGGEPLVNARLSVYGRGNDHSQSTRSDNEGRFVMEGLKSGTYQLTITRPGLGGMEYRAIDVHSDLEGVRIDLEPSTATLTGVVVDARTGQPINFALVTAADAATIGALASSGDTAPLVSGSTASFTINDGRFELKLRANAEQLWVTQEGYEGTRIPLDVNPGQHLEGLVIELQPAAPESPNQ